MNSQELVKAIKSSKKYKHISEEIIEAKVKEYLKQNENWERYKEKFLLKEIKALLHGVYGSFQVKSRKKREKFLKELKDKPEDLNVIEKMLTTNRSTRERLDDYEEFYDKLFKMTGKPKSIIDLGSGINPVSCAYYLDKNEKITYHAYEIDERDVDFLNQFFKIVASEVNGKAEILNLGKIENIKSLPSADICFMFKLVDVIEKNGHKYSEEVIKVLIEKVKFIVLSFPTITVSGKPMKFADRGWIERLLDRINLKYEKFVITNEIFYVISKK
jgi:hypothetical protein